MTKQATLPPMAEGGKWLQSSNASEPPVYVVHEAHLARLMNEQGYREVDDPRRPEDVYRPTAPQPSPNELALAARVEQLEEQLRQVLARTEK